MNRATARSYIALVERLTDNGMALGDALALADRAAALDETGASPDTTIRTPDCFAWDVADGEAAGLQAVAEGLS